MKISEKGIEFIKNWEKCRLESYLDQAGIPTIGWGSITYPNGSRVKLGEKISQYMADRMFKLQIEEKEKAVDKLTKFRTVKLNQNQFDALVSLAYNIGTGPTGFAGSTVLKLVRENPFNPKIRGAFMMWNKIRKSVNGVRKLVPSTGLTRRRREEADMYFSPV